MIWIDHLRNCVIYEPQLPAGGPGRSWLLPPSTGLCAVKRVKDCNCYFVVWLLPPTVQFRPRNRKQAALGIQPDKTMIILDQREDRTARKPTLCVEKLPSTVVPVNQALAGGRPNRIAAVGHQALDCERLVAMR